MEREEYLILISARLNNARMRTGISLEKLANMLDLSVLTVWRYMSGKNDIPSYYLMRMCEIFNISVDLFRWGDSI